MKKIFRILYLFLLSIMLFSACSEDRDAMFERPGWLEPPIYKVLENEGRFTDYLKCVDRTLYSSTLKSSGLYTVFAPNDDAFKAYFASSNGAYSSVADMPDSLVNKIVSYSIVYNKYDFDRLTDVLSSGWDTLSSIKKKTTYYETIHQENYMGSKIWAFDMPSFNLGDQNYKYIPLYLTSVFERFRTSEKAAEDYKMFYPNSIYSGENAQSANIVKKDLVAENGVVHEINRVLEPLPNLEKLLDDNNYSAFKALLNLKGTTGVPYFLSYTYNKSLTEFFQEAMPDKGIDNVYLKSYSGLPFNLNGERYGNSGSDAEKGGFTLFAPTNKAVDKFYNEKLKPYYPDGIETVSKDALGYFINAQMIDQLVWPDDYKGSMNSLGEFFNGKGARGNDFNAADFSKIVPASNGLFYGSDNYIRSRYFETVFTEILLNPKYSLLNRAFSEYFESTLKEELLKCELNGYTQENYTVLLPSDDLLKDDGFSWVWLSASNKYGFSNSNSGSSLGNFDVATRIQRLVKSHIFKRLKNEEVNCAITDFQTDPSFAAAYGGYSYAVNEYGDMIRYKDGQIQMVGNYDDKDWVTATPYKTFSNGQVFKVDKMLQYSRRKTYPNSSEGYTTRDLILYILEMASASQNPNVALYKNYLVQCLKGDESNELAGLSADMTLTIFMPTNTAINKAVTNGDLPAYSLVSSGDVAARQKATEFILYHIVKGKEFVDDGLTYIMPNDEVVREEVWPTVLKDVVDNTYLAIRKDASGKLIVSTKVESTGRKLSAQEKTATVTRGLKRSNYFGAKAVMHEINDYFSYKRVE